MKHHCYLFIHYLADPVTDHHVQKFLRIDYYYSITNWQYFASVSGSKPYRVDTSPMLQL